ncbi:MAG: putative Ig domain-containing protein, partial [Actinobacteria bacterium]|nr:putative Ig domain-containing protein [Actinomycetota bacterium]
MERAAVTAARPARERSDRDRGFNLVEILIAIVLSGIVSGVIVSTLFTSLDVIDNTTNMVADSTDQSLVSTYLYRDAQASAGTDPSTVQAATGVGVAVPKGGGDWGGCEQDGTLVVRFSWVDRAATTDLSTVATWAVDRQGQLVRRSCDADGTVDLVLGRNISSVVAACSPDPTCVGESTSISLAVSGANTRVPSDYTLTASLRGDLQVAPGVERAAPVALLVLGEQSATGACPVLDLAGKRQVTVLGNVVVSASCGASPITGDRSLLNVSGTTSVLSRVDDPYASVVPPTDDCSRDSGMKPGSSTGADDVVVHTSTVTLSGAIEFRPGRHVFCKGLSVADGATITGNGVLWYVRGGLKVSTTATVDLSPAVTGPYGNLLVWAIGTDGVAIGGDPISSYRGGVYAPGARVTVTSGTAIQVGTVAAAEVTIGGSGFTRLGLPVPTLSPGIKALPTGQAGVAYPTTPIAYGGGTAPYAYSVSGLPSGLVMSANGSITGTPTAAGSFTVRVVVNDATQAYASVTYPLTIRTAVSVSAPTTLPNGQVGAAYTSTTMTAAGGLAPYSWSASGLPAGMSMTSAGVLRGTPTASGTYTSVVTLADSAGGVATRSYTLTIGVGGTPSNPFGAAKRFQIITEGNATLGSFGIEGAAAIGGNLVFKNYQTVAASETSTFTPSVGGQAVGLVVGGTVDLAGSGANNQLTVGTGFFHVGAIGGGALTTWGANVHLATAGVTDNWSTPRAIVTADQSNQTSYPVVAPGVFDTASTFTQFRASEASIAALDPATCSSIAAPTVTTAFGNYTLTLVAGRVNVWNLTLAQITAMGNVSGPTNVSATTPLVINVTDAGTITMPERYWGPLQSGTKSAIMWNFPNATAVNVKGVFYGSLFAPDAAVTIDNVTFEGDVVARTATITSGRYGLAHWTTAIPCTLGALSVQGPGSFSNGQVGIAYGATMDGSGGSPAYSWAASGLPAGLTMTSAGVVSGTPTTAGVYTATVTVTDAVGATASRAYTFTIRSAPAVATPSSLPGGTVGTAYTSTTFTGSGGLAPYTWSATGVPAGLTVSSAGVLSGTPTANGTFSVVVTLRDSAGAATTRTYSLSVTGVVCPTITGWRGEYFNNLTLTGPAALCRNDATIDFAWASGTPDPSVVADRFTARWTRTVNFTAGTYRFTAGADDGLR